MEAGDGRSRQLSVERLHDQEQDRRSHQTTKAGVKRGDESSVRHQSAIRGGQAGAHTANRAGQAAEHHRGLRIVEPHEPGEDRGKDHDQNRLDHPGGDAQRHDIG